MYNKTTFNLGTQLNLLLVFAVTPSVVQLSEFLARDPEVPGSIPGATTFSEK
jgi:hypothetical protein